MSATVSVPAAPARTSDLFAPGLRGLTIGLVLTITLVALESLAIGTVMPAVSKELGDLPLFGWVYTAFFLGSMIGIVLAGGVLDRMPLQRPFAVGLGLFGLGLVIGGFAPSMPVLIAARFLQGLGGGALTPTAYVAIGRCLPERLQPRMFAMLSTAWVVPGILGPSLAAVVGEVAGWRWVFLGLIPLLALAGGLALNALRHVPAAARPAAGQAAAGDGSRPRGDLRRFGAALAAAAGACLLIVGLGAANPLVLIAGAALGVAILLPTYRWLTPPGTLRLAAGVPAATFLRGLMTFSFFSADAYIALLLQTWRGTPLALTGVVFTVTTIAWTLGTWTQARRIDRYGPRRFVSLGFACIAIGGLLTLPVVVAGAPPELTILTWAIPGIGMGFMYSAVTLVVLRGVEESEQGSASSSLQLSDILGTALGAGVAGAIIAAGTRTGPEGLGAALAAVLVLSIGASMLGVLASGRVGSFAATRAAPEDRVSAAVD